MDQSKVTPSDALARIGSKLATVGISVRLTQRIVELMILCSALGMVASTATAAPAEPSGLTQTAPPGVSWRRLSQCTVLVEDAVDVPALESGVIVELAVKRNQTVAPKHLIARLDQQQAKVAVEMAEQKLKSAESQVQRDKGYVDVQHVVLQEFQSELSSYEKIAESVSNSEIRRMNLRVTKARSELDSARAAVAQAQVGAKLAESEIKLAQIRLARRNVSAPQGGVVSEIEKRAGEWVQAGEAIARIENLDTLGVDAIVPASSIDRSSIVGTSIRVVVTEQDVGKSPGNNPENNARSEIRLPGRVTSFDYKVSGRGLIRLHCRFRNTMHRGQHLLLPGDTVDLEIAIPGPSSTASSTQPVGQPSVSR